MKEGSIGEVTARLRLWCARRGRGLARVEWDSAYSRREVVSRLNEFLAQKQIAITELRVPDDGSPYANINEVIEQLAAVRSGVVSITGVEGVFPDNQRRLETLSALNFQRERLASFPIRQIWWIPSHLTQLLILGVPDLDSWFELRLHLTEVIAPELKPQELEEIRQKTVPPEEARALAQRFWDRLKAAREQNVPDEQIWNELALPAVEALAFAGLLDETYDIVAELPNAETRAERQLDHVKRSEGPLSRAALTNERMLAGILQRRGDLPRARGLKEHLLAAQREQFGDLNQATMSATADLLSTLVRQEDLAAARPLSEQLLINSRQLFGDEHPKTLNAMQVLALTMKAQGDVEGAERLETQIAEIRARQERVNEPVT